MENKPMNTNANVRRARLLIHWYTAFAIHYVFIEVQACGEQAELQADQTKSDENGTYFGSSFLDGQIQGLLVLLESGEEKTQKQKSRYCGEALKAISFCAEVSGEINKRQ